jgi:hypothetical protein
LLERFRKSPHEGALPGTIGTQNDKEKPGGLKPPADQPWDIAQEIADRVQRIGSQFPQPQPPLKFSEKIAQGPVGAGLNHSFSPFLTEEFRSYSLRLRFP